MLYRWTSSYRRIEAYTHVLIGTVDLYIYILLSVNVGDPTTYLYNYIFGPILL